MTNITISTKQKLMENKSIIQGGKNIFSYVSSNNDKIM